MIGIYGLVAVMGENMVKDIETHQSVAVINNLPEEIKAEFSDFIANNDVKLTENGSMIPDDELRTAIRDGQTDLYVSFPKDFMAQTTAGKTPDISMYYNPAEEYSQKASEEFEAVMNETVYNKLLSERLGGSLDVLNVFTMNAGNTDFAIVDEQKASGKALSMFLPYIIVILLFSGTMALGVDAISGEKERGTMASLFTDAGKPYVHYDGQAFSADNAVYDFGGNLYCGACCRDAGRDGRYDGRGRISVDDAGSDCSDCRDYDCACSIFRSAYKSFGSACKVCQGGFKLCVAGIYCRYRCRPYDNVYDRRA